MRAHHATPLLVDGVLYGFSDSILTALDIETGALFWRDRSISKGSLTFADGRLYIFGERGEVALVEPSRTGYREHGRFRFPNPTARGATPGVIRWWRTDASTCATRMCCWPTTSGPAGNPEPCRSPSPEVPAGSFVPGSAGVPNGGSDCCGTCWFNRANRGKAGSANHDSSVRSCCEIRAVAIENPFYTYCANHPHRRPDRDPIPIGPILRPGEVRPTSPEIGPALLDSRPRVVWKPSPDTEEVRRHLLHLRAGLRRHAAKDRYFPTPRTRGDGPLAARRIRRSAGNPGSGTDRQPRRRGNGIPRPSRPEGAVPNPGANEDPRLNRTPPARNRPAARQWFLRR